MAAENNVFLNNSGTNEQIFKIPTAYDHYGWYAHVKNIGSQNLLPVRSGKFKMAAENNIFLNNLRTNKQIFKIPTAYDHYGCYAHVKNIGSQNLLPVCSGKLKMVVEMCKMGYPFRIERVTTSKVYRKQWKQNQGR